MLSGAAVHYIRTIMRAELEVQSDVRSLRASTVERALRSFSFFARAVLGLRRRLSEDRCEELEAGAEPRFAFERKALSAWEDFVGGRATPSELSWALPAAAPQEEGRTRVAA